MMCGMRLAVFSLLTLAASAQTFEVATVKPSGHPVGRDGRGVMTFEPTRASVRNASLFNLIVDAYNVQPFQVTGGPGWLDVDEFDLDARTGAPASSEQMHGMLQALLAERFHLALHREAKQMRSYALMVDKAAKLHRAVGPLQPSTSPGNFHGDMRQFANIISIGLTIPPIEDPTRPSIASGPPVPVIDKTGLDGNYDISVDLQRDPGGDAYTRWQHALRDQLGLKLEAERGPVEVLVIDRVERKPEQAGK